MTVRTASRPRRRGRRRFCRRSTAHGRSRSTQDRVEVTLLDRNDYHQFQPLLYQVATSMLAPGDIAYPLRKIAAEFDT